MKLPKFQLHNVKKDKKALLILSIFLFIFVVVIGTAFIVGKSVEKYQKGVIEDAHYWWNSFPKKVHYYFLHDTLFVFSELSDITYWRDEDWYIDDIESIKNQGDESLKEVSEYLRNEYSTRLFNVGYIINKWTGERDTTTSKAAIHIQAAIEHLYNRGIALADFFDKIHVVITDSNPTIEELSQDKDLSYSHQELERARIEIDEAITMILAMDFNRSELEGFDDVNILIKTIEFLFEDEEGNYRDDFITERILFIKSAFEKK